MKFILGLILSGNLLFLLMSETLLLGYANAIGILALGVFTVIWTNRTKKEVVKVKETVAEVKGTVDIVHTTINSMRDKELKQTQELGEAVGKAAGKAESREEAREDKIDKTNI